MPRNFAEAFQPYKTVWKNPNIPGATFGSKEEADEAERRKKAMDAVAKAKLRMGEGGGGAMPSLAEAGLTPDVYTGIPEAEAFAKDIEGKEAERAKTEKGRNIAAAYARYKEKNPEAATAVLDFLKDAGMYEEISKALTSQEKGAAGGFGGWKPRTEDWDKISAMPEGEEKQGAITEYLYKWAPSVGYGSSEAAVSQTARKSAASAAASTGARIRTEAGLSEVAAETQRKKSAGAAAGGIEGSMEAEYASLPEAIRPTKKISPEAADKLGLKAQGVSGAYRLKGLLDTGGVGMWDLTPAGDFTNPEASQAYQDAIEALARMNTGAAFTSSEDKRFARELGNWKMLLTEKGRKAINEGLARFIKRQEGSANTVWGNDGWKAQYGVTGSLPEETAGAGASEFDSLWDD